MQLSPGERALLAYFPSSSAAESAAKELRNNDYDTVQVDRVSRYGATNDAEINNALMGRAETITGLTLYSAGTDSFVDNDTRVLLGADPSVSGYGNHDYGVAGGSAFLVTVVTTDDYTGRAEEILKNNGGKL
ncbi:hypothetical protein [Desulfoscipio gibsoniae]|uniref:Uncharacterized protein n=1 Tax=Desulfoscipio gibsoniae DSM 7213 TaxID=767817 RepID=R4KPN8_9FIRM|nr:hypothetical protein [Desulfoscipio gibsoniae]AGL01621.1 hypothetical protein Desgi_2192 [Desulfoscipio gibsoniae DSM 7213]